MAFKLGNLSPRDLDVLIQRAQTPDGAPKYRNPDRPMQTWMRHGIRQRWFVAALKKPIVTELSLRITHPLLPRAQRRPSSAARLAESSRRRSTTRITASPTLVRPTRRENVGQQGSGSTTMDLTAAYTKAMPGLGERFPTCRPSTGYAELLRVQGARAGRPSWRLARSEDGIWLVRGSVVDPVGAPSPSIWSSRPELLRSHAGGSAMPAQPSVHLWSLPLSAQDYARRAKPLARITPRPLERWQPILAPASAHTGAAWPSWGERL